MAKRSCTSPTGSPTARKTRKDSGSSCCSSASLEMEAEMLEQALLSMPANGPEDQDGFRVQEKERRRRKQTGGKEFRPRQHPATRKQPAPRDSKLVTVLFRPDTNSASLHALKRPALVASLQPAPVTGIRKIARGGLAVDLKEGSDPAQLLALSSLLDQPVKSCLPRSGQATLATVFCPHVEADEFLELYQLHESNPALANHRPMGTRGRFLLRFQAGPLPASIVLFADGEPVPVQSFYKDPVRCSRCQRFNHTASDCRSQPTCRQCGKSGENHKDCRAAPRCANCGGKHTASSKSCPHRQFETQVNRQQAVQRCTRAEARSSAVATYAEKLKGSVRAAPQPATTNISSFSQRLPCHPLSSSQPSLPPPSAPARRPVRSMQMEQKTSAEVQAQATGSPVSHSVRPASAGRKVRDEGSARPNGKASRQSQPAKPSLSQPRTAESTGGNLFSFTHVCRFFQELLAALRPVLSASDKSRLQDVFVRCFNNSPEKTTPERTLTATQNA